MLHALLVAILFVSLLTFPDPPPGQEGILIALGEPDVGMGNEKPRASTEEADLPDPADETDDEETPPEVEETPEPIEEVEEPVEKPEPSKEVNTDDRAEELALKRKKEEERKKRDAERKKKAEEDRKRKEAEAKKKKAEEDARRKKAEEERKRKEAEAKKQAEFEKTKNQIGDLFSGGSQGNTGKPGSQGDPNGDPNSDILEGISTGSGKIGGGLGNRGGRGPAVRDNSQETGRVVVKVCVDRNGRVVSAKFTQRGSTTSSSNLIRKAVENAKRYSFKTGDIDKQCGTITYDFRVK